MLTKLHIRMNDGSELYIALDAKSEYMKEAKKHRTVRAYMVCVEINGNRVMRWDRELISGNNNWRKVAPDRFETLGRLPVINRVHRN